MGRCGSGMCRRCSLLFTYDAFVPQTNLIRKSYSLCSRDGRCTSRRRISRPGKWKCGIWS